LIFKFIFYLKGSNFMKLTAKKLVSLALAAGMTSAICGMPLKASAEPTQITVANESRTSVTFILKASGVWGPIWYRWFRVRAEHDGEEKTGSPKFSVTTLASNTPVHAAPKFRALAAPSGERCQIWGVERYIGPNVPLHVAVTVDLEGCATTGRWTVDASVALATQRALGVINTRDMVTCSWHGPTTGRISKE
jgi:hypothetical protein